MKILQDKMFHEISAGGVVIKRNKGLFQVLIIHRNQMNDWTLPKGHQKKGESLQETALREVKEETSISAKLQEYLGQTHYQFFDSKRHYFYFRTVHWFLMTSQKTKITKKKDREIIKALWHPFNKELYQLLTYKEDKKLLKRVQLLLKHFSKFQ